MRAIVNKRINTRWFSQTLKDLGLSQRQYAEKVGQHNAAINRMFRGRRHFRLEDAETFCKVTGASIEDVLANAGLSIEDITGERMVKVVGWIDGTHAIHPRVKGPRSVIAPPGSLDDTLAYRFQTSRTELDAMDGAVIYCRPFGDPSIDMLNRWCVVKLKSGEELMRVLKRGARAGRFNLWINGEEKEAGVILEGCSAVEWMRF